MGRSHKSLLRTKVRNTDQGRMTDNKSENNVRIRILGRIKRRSHT